MPSPRYWPFIACILLALVSFAGLAFDVHWLWSAVVFGLLAIVGIADLAQPQQTLRRNYPLLAHLRYFLESIGPEIRQYFIESDTSGRPFSRHQRSIVYQRAKDALDKRPFGTQLDVYAERYEWINHSLRPTTPASHDFRVEIGVSAQQPYSASVFNISAMSFGSLSANAILALNEGRGAATSTTTPARARSRAITASRAATWCGRSVRATSAAGIPRGISTKNASPPTRSCRRCG